MTAGARPNLGGLFNGSTPPDSLNGSAVRPRLILSRPLVGEDVSPPPGSTTARAGVTSSSPAAPPRQAGLEWLDPVRAVEQYFAFLQTLLDANRGLMVALTTTVVSLPERLGMRS